MSPNIRHGPQALSLADDGNDVAHVKISSNPDRAKRVAQAPQVPNGTAAGRVITVLPRGLERHYPSCRRLDVDHINWNKGASGLPGLHIWLTGTAGCAIEIRQTQPNIFRLRADLQTNAAFLRLEPASGAENGFTLPLSTAQLHQPAMLSPDRAGHSLTIHVRHTRLDKNEHRHWGWTCRLVRHGNPLTCAGESDGEPLLLDQLGWIV